MSKVISIPSKYIPNVHFDFPNKEKKTPKNFDSLQVDSEITIVVKGTVKSIGHDLNSRSFSMTFPKVKIMIPETSPTTMADAMAKAEDARKI